MSSRNSNLRKKYNIPKTNIDSENDESKPNNEIACEESPRTITNKYNQLETSELIDTLNKDLQEEKEKCKVLEEGNYDAKKKELLEFSEKYSEIIYQHMKVLEETVNELKKMVEKNNTLSTAKVDYEDYISRSDTKCLLETITKLSQLKKDGESFLMSRRTKK